MEIRTDIEKLEKAFDKLNEHYYQGQLPKVVIHYYMDKSLKCYGHFTCGKVWRDEETCMHEINISANMTEGEHVWSTLLHEMAHLYNCVNKIKDTNDIGFYHNNKFRATAESHGLICNKVGNYGWTETKLNEEAKEFCKSLELPSMKNTYGTLFKKMTQTSEEGEEETEGEEKGADKEKKPRAKWYKYVCPVCGEVIKCKNEYLRIKCEDCDEYFVREEKK